jgi:hypothetical protein
MKFNRYDILTAHYTKQIQAYNWQAVLDDAAESCYINENDEIEGKSFLGSVFSIMPSGKYYMPWCTNQTRSDVTKDECFYDALESIASEYGLWITSGEGDPCDLFAGKLFEYDEVKQWLTSEDAERAKELFTEDEDIELTEDMVVE